MVSYFQHQAKGHTINARKLKRFFKLRLSERNAKEHESC
jgi:thymidylate synthase ThyX